MSSDRKFAANEWPFLFDLIFFKTNIKNKQQALFSAQCCLVLKIWPRDPVVITNLRKKNENNEKILKINLACCHVIC